jgi:hypothetical protein
MSDPNGAYWDSGHLMHKETVERVTELLSEAHGDEPAILEDGSHHSFHEEIAEALKAPENPGDYNFRDVIQLQEGQEWDDDLAEEATHWALMNEIPVQEAQGIAKRYQELSKLDTEGLVQLRETTEEGLQKHWGDNYSRNMDACRAVVESVGSGFKEFLNTSRLGDDYSLALTLYRVAQQRGLVQ